MFVRLQPNSKIQFIIEIAIFKYQRTRKTQFLKKSLLLVNQNVFKTFQLRVLSETINVIVFQAVSVFIRF